MRVRQLDENHDWTFGANNANYANGSAAIAQCVQTRLLSLYHDWFLDPELGIHWFDYLDKTPDLRAMEGDVKGRVLDTVGVVEITGYGVDLDPDTRKLTVTIAYIDIYGREQEVSSRAPSYG